MTVHNKMDAQALGADATVHPLLGCVIGHGNGTPEQQARNWLYSRRRATQFDIAGRDRNLDLTEAEYRKLLADLAVWEKSNSVVLPPPVPDITRRYGPAPPKPTVDNVPAVTKLVPSTDRAARDALAAAPTPSTAHH